MPAWYQIQFSDETPFREWHGSRGFYYEFADTTNLELRSRIAWCCNCFEFIDAEWIPSLEVIESELAELNDPTSFRASSFASTEQPFDKSPFIERLAELYAEAKVEAAKRIEWRKTRKSPPRCLICGDTEVRFPGENQMIDIPGRGAAMVQCMGMCSTEFSNWFYTPEGIRIERDTKPSYWQPPRQEE